MDKLVSVSQCLLNMSLSFLLRMCHYTMLQRRAMWKELDSASQMVLMLTLTKSVFSYSNWTKLLLLLLKYHAIIAITFDTQLFTLN